MFFLRYLEREINIHPSFFGNNVHDRLKDQLYADMEGSCNGEYYVVCIMDIYNISPGKVMPGSGEATFVILYRAILWKPFKGETVGAFSDYWPKVSGLTRVCLVSRSTVWLLESSHKESFAKQGL
jgi:DNA-directed RNA polymerase II subunit RPB7